MLKPSYRRSSSSLCTHTQYKLTSLLYMRTWYKFILCACTQPWTWPPIGWLEHTCDKNCYFRIKNICTVIWEIFGSNYMHMYTLSVTQSYLNAHLTWVLGQFNMYIIWHRFCYESTCALIRIPTYVLKIHSVNRLKLKF